MSEQNVVEFLGLPYFLGISSSPAAFLFKIFLSTESNSFCVNCPSLMSRKIKRQKNYCTCSLCVCVYVFGNLSVLRFFFFFFSPFCKGFVLLGGCFWGSNWISFVGFCSTLAKNFLCYFDEKNLFFYTWPPQFFPFITQLWTPSSVLWTGFSKTRWRDKRWTRVTYSCSKPLLSTGN